MARVKSFGTSNPHQVLLLGTIIGNDATERLLHKRFAEHRHCGEWFRYSEDLAGEIARFCHQGGGWRFRAEGY